MKIEPLTSHPITKVIPVKKDKRPAHQKDRQQKQQQHVEEQKDDSPIQHIDEII